MSAWTVAWLLVLGGLVGVLAGARPVALGAAAAAALLVGWLLDGYGFWGYAAAALAALGTAAFANRLQRGRRFAWRSSG